jgi:hypothetical protein
MKVEQTIEREGDHLVLKLIEHPSGRVLARRVWEGAARYVAEHGSKAFVLRVPRRAGLNIRPGTAQK